MTPEEKYHSDRWFVLQKIRERELYAPNKNEIRYHLEITPYSKFEQHLPSAQINILKQLADEGAIKILDEESKSGYGAYYLFILQIQRPKFDELYRNEEIFKKEGLNTTTPTSPNMDTGSGDKIKSQPDGQKLPNTADEKKLCVLEKLKEEWDLAPVYEKNGVRVVFVTKISEERYDKWIRECGLEDEERLMDILATFQQRGVVVSFRKKANFI